MFGQRWGSRRNREAWAWQGADEASAHEGWQGWHRHDAGSPFEWVMMRMARRFPFGPGRHGGEMPFFGRGDLKYALLELLIERPKHGYEMIKELEDKAGGFYTPSAGAVYPALQLMEDREWITSQTVEGKKVYTITEAGKKAFHDHQQEQEQFEGARGFGRGPGRGFGRGFGPGRSPFDREARPAMRELYRDTMEVVRLFWTAAVSTEGDLTKLGELRKIVENVRHQLMTFMDEQDDKRKNDQDEVKF